jgi:hypothetical protein
VVYAWLATLVLAAHLAFILFVAAGAVLVLRWPRLIGVHLTAVAWGVFVEITGRPCPLTPLENALRARAGDGGYAGDFIEHYLGAIVYPPGLDQHSQWFLAGLAVAWNAAAYVWIIRRRRRSRER